MLNKLNINKDFYEIETVKNLQWQKAMFTDRHVFTRYACHGFHHLFCKNGTFHFDAAEECICKFCDQQCSQYYISKCEAKKISIREAAKMES